MRKKKSFVLISAMLLSLVTGCNTVTLKPLCYHEWGPWEIVEISTSTEKGKVSHVCKICGKKQIFEGGLDDLDDLDIHKWVSDSESDFPASCVKTGITGSTKCIYCGEKREGTIVPLTDHKFNVYTTKSNDVNFYLCKDCGYCGYELSLSYSRQSQGEDIYEYYPLNPPRYSNKIFTWDINIEDIPAGNYDIDIVAKVYNERDKYKKYYNMSNPTLATEEDLELNSMSSYPDNESDSDYRAYLYANGVKYVPSTKKNFGELGLQSDETSISRYRRCELVKNVSLQNVDNQVSLCLGYSANILLLDSIFLIPLV